MSVLFYKLGVESRKLAEVYDAEEKGAIEAGNVQLANAFADMASFHRKKSNSYFRMGATGDVNDEG